MTSGRCSNCNVIGTAEHALRVCNSCERVAYCSRKCQKEHWAIHKPACRAGFNKDRDSYEDSGDELNDAEEESSNVGKGFKDENDNLIVGDVTYPVGTYIEWFTMPTPEHPRGYKDMINLDKPLAIWFASLSDEESKTVEKQIVEGYKSGHLMVWEIFYQIAQQKGSESADFKERAKDPKEYENALQILAGRYNATKPQAVDISKRSGSTFVRFDEQGDVVLLDFNEEQFVVPADTVSIVETKDEEGQLELEIVFFDSDTIANMKYLRNDEKVAYKEMMAREMFEKHDGGDTVANAGRIKAAEEAENDVEQKTSEDDLDNN